MCCQFNISKIILKTTFNVNRYEYNMEKLLNLYMINLAIVIASSEYLDPNDNLPTVKNDFRLISNILHLSGKYTEILTILDNKNSSEVKSLISTFINKYKTQEINEIFFYFSGHGVRRIDKERDELFLKLYNTTEEKILSSSLSNTEIDGYLRECNPKLAVKFLDCCNSGTHYLKESSSSLVKNFESIKSKFNDLIFLSSSRENEPSHALEDFSFFTKAIALSILENQVDTEIYYKDLISSINDYSNSTYYPEPRLVMQGAFLHPFIKYNDEILNFLTEKEQIKPFNIFEIGESNPDDKVEDESFGLLALKKVILEKSNNYLDKQEILNYVRTVQNVLLNTEYYRDISELFEISVLNDIELYEEDSIGTWLIENVNKDYFAQPRYEQESYTTQEYVPAPQKVRKVKKPSTKSLSFLSRLASEYQEYEEVEQVLKSVTKYRSILKGFKITCSLISENDEKIYTKFLLSLKPKNNYLCLRAYDVYLVILFSSQEIATFTQITTLKSYDWDRYEKVKSTKWFVKENYFKSVKPEEYAQQVISSIRKKLEESIKDHIANSKESSEMS